MTGGTSNGDAIALGVWALAVAGVPLGLYAAASRWRGYLPERVRGYFGLYCEGDLVPCDCGAMAAAETWPDPCGGPGMALCCGECGAVLEVER